MIEREAQRDDKGCTCVCGERLSSTKSEGKKEEDKRNDKEKEIR